MDTTALHPVSHAVLGPARPSGPLACCTTKILVPRLWSSLPFRSGDRLKKTETTTVVVTSLSSRGPSRCRCSPGRRAGCSLAADGMQGRCRHQPP